MFHPDKWPFTPVCLSEILDQDTLSVVISGCCERLGKPLTILDCVDNTGTCCHRIEAINEINRYESFCRFLRSDRGVRGGDEACRLEDIKQAKTSLQAFYQTRDPFRSFTCYMGLQDMTFIVRIRNRPVAAVFSGQYCLPDGRNSIREIVQGLGAGAYAHIQISEVARRQLLAFADDLSLMPEDARIGLEREARHIQRVAEAEFERGKRQWEQDFLDRLRQVSIASSEIKDRGQLQSKLQHMVEMTREFCRCEYAVFFGSVQEGDTGLAPIAMAGLLPEITGKLPHFNWKKAGLPLGNWDVETWDIGQWQRDAVKGLRGENTLAFAASGVIPMSLSDRYRGALVLGPFAETVEIREERRFLTDVTNTIGLFGLTGLEVLYLERERRRWESTATLLTHQLRTALTPITAQIGRAKDLVQKGSGGVDTRRVGEFLSRAETMSLLLARGARKTLEGHVLQVEKDDLEFERYPLSVIVENCAAAVTEQVRQKGLDLVVESSVELLPEADVDVARFTIALSNLIDNAIKYSFSESRIMIKSHIDLTGNSRQETAVIDVDDIGMGIPEEDQKRIFEQGARGLAAAKMGNIPGSGLGLWEAQAVVSAHGGMVRVRSTPTAIRRREGQAHHVIFSLEIPLRQPSKQKPERAKS